MKYILIVIALCWASLSFSQTKFKIQGTLVAEQDSIPLESATVYLETPKDSTLVTYTITDREGKFTLEDRVYVDKLRLIISLVGFETYNQEISLNKENINLGKIFMLEANMLDEVIIKSRAPITVKKDTLEFNVASFKTKKDANVEDLLKELPGVEVDDEGKILVNGKEVNKILVNGKPFFGDDPTITTRNLTKEIIEKVQITDTKSKSEGFTGEQGDSENKTINLTIKEENNKGVFGRLAAGAGTDERYEYAGMVNIFDNEQRISVLAGGNNINSAGFSFGEIRKMFGGANSISFDGGNGSFTIDGRSFGGGQGITRSNTAGVNYADELKKGVDISTDYFYSGSHSDNATSTQRENFLPDSRYFTNSNSSSQADTDAHTVNLGFDVEVDSTLLMNFDPNFRYSRASTTFQRQEESLDENFDLTNQSFTDSYVENIGKNFSNELQVTKKFGSKGSFLRLQMNLDINSTESDDFLYSETDVFGDNPSQLIRDQFADSERSNNHQSSNITYRIPIVDKKWFVDLWYNYDLRKQENRESTFDFNETTQAYDQFNFDLSTDFTSKSDISTPGMKLVYTTEKMNFNVRAGYAFRTIQNRDALRPGLNLKRDFELPEFSTGFNYRFNPKMSLYFDYNYSNRTPEISQLQPFQNVSDPLNTITGNPDLRPIQEHRAYLGFNKFDFQKGTGFYLYANGGLTNDQVVSKTTINENFVRNTTYENVDGAYYGYIGASYSKDFKVDSLQTVKARVGFNSNINRSINFNNGVRYASKSLLFTPTMSLTYTWKKLFEIRPNYRLSFNTTTYDLDNLEDRKFLRHNLGIRTATFFPKRLEWRNDINYTYNPNVADGFQKSSWFWNSTLAYSILQDKGAITFKVYDLLNQNTNAQRTATQNFIQDQQSTVLEQYFMLSFSWKFNSLGKKGETGDGGVFYFD
ncbi:outer membrane beta-barrel protein [Subsaxibacter sp. CAU 1640]|uniref:outer membrane beta-barrel protein n=1 Tax=Subsaxibacter sp. CAU 1640 TaxID=2933271 RepID=UPI0020047706|nr:outer membrane beta-barrel protein [Subsaxibacter sp. CAU 1640]MCK7590092.1 outer membrane beta-barrel protein [Subsaxibacter sp. CAU 1640]